MSALPQNVVTGNANTQPRVQLGGVPFAVQVLTVPDGSITAAKLAPDVSMVPPDGSITTTLSLAARIYIGSGAQLISHTGYTYIVVAR